MYDKPGFWDKVGDKSVDILTQLALILIAENQPQRAVELSALVQAQPDAPDEKIAV